MRDSKRSLRYKWLRAYRPAVATEKEDGVTGRDYFQSYLDAATDASSLVIKVVATLLLLSGFALLSVINSLQGSWLRQRLSLAATPGSAYVRQRVGPIPPANTADWELYKIRYASFYTTLTKAESDSFYAQHLPIPGAPSIDINDVGPIFGVGFALLMSLLVVALRGCQHSVAAAFEYAAASHQLPHMQRLLEIRQRLDATPGKSHVLAGLGRALVWLALAAPCMIYSTIVVRDLQAASLNFESAYFAVRLVVEGSAMIVVVLLTVLSIRCAYEVKWTWLRFHLQPQRH
ncbi:MAG TPA: hypothetical protein VF713_22405 [Thermoanaerobaculia bacterium]